jgi:hypothetical protein
VVYAAGGTARARAEQGLPRHAASRLFIGARNLVFTLLRREFRTFSDPSEAMLRVVEERGFRRSSRRAPMW